MTLRIAELHHFAVRIGPGPDAAAAALRFYNDVLGLESDHVPWDRPGEGQRINAGAHAQIHLVPGAAKPRARRSASEWLRVARSRCSTVGRGRTRRKTW